MQGKTIPAVVTRNIPQLNLNIGDKVNVVSKLYDEDTRIVNEWRFFHLDKKGYILPNKDNGKLLSPAVIAPKGSYKTSFLITEDNRTYSSQTIVNAIGYRPYQYFLKKI